MADDGDMDEDMSRTVGAYSHDGEVTRGCQGLRDRKISVKMKGKYTRVYNTVVCTTMLYGLATLTSIPELCNGWPLAWLVIQ